VSRPVRGAVESESTEPPAHGAIEEVVREEPAPRYWIRQGYGRESIDTPAAGALSKAGTRATLRRASSPPGDGISSRDGWANTSARVGAVIEHPRSVPGSAARRHARSTAQVAGA
jgi:hypothetical protein